MNLAESSPNNHEPYHVGCPRNEGQLCYQAIGVTGQQDFFHCLAAWDRRSLRGSIDLGRLVVEMLLKNYFKKIANNYMHSYYIYAFYCNHWTTLCIVPSVRVGCKLIVKTQNTLVCPNFPDSFHIFHCHPQNVRSNTSRLELLAVAGSKDLLVKIRVPG